MAIDLKGSFQVIKARNGLNTLIYNEPPHNYWLHSSYNPLIEAKRWAGEINCNPDDILVILGVGLGYHLNYLIDKVPQGKIIAIEPDPRIRELYYQSENYDQLQSDSRFIIYPGNISLSKFLIAIIDEFALEKVKCFTYKPIERLFSDIYLNYIKAIKEALYILLVARNTDLFFSVRWVENFFANLPYIITSPPASCIYSRFLKRPGIVVSAGPSLNKNIELLKEVQGKAVILVVGTALKPVLAKGIRPSFAVSIDGSPANYEHFRDLPDHTCPLIFDGIIYPEIVERYRGIKLASVFYNVFSDWLEKRLEINPARLIVGPSVASTAFDYALKLGLDPIIFVGQDLAYSGEFTHARGTVYDNNKPVEDAKKITLVEDVYGKKVATSYPMLAMLRALETQIDSMAMGRKIIDATEGGARIAGTEIMTLREALDIYCQKNFYPEETINEIITAYQPPGKDDLATIAQRIREEEKELGGAAAICRTGERLAKDLELVFTSREPDQRRVDKLLKRLEDVDAELKELQSRLLPVSMVFQPIWFQLKNGPFARPEDDWCAEGLRVAKKSQLLYEGLTEGITIVRRAMDQAASRLEQFWQ